MNMDPMWDKIDQNVSGNTQMYPCNKSYLFID